MPTSRDLVLRVPLGAQHQLALGRLEPGDDAGQRAPLDLRAVSQDGGHLGVQPGAYVEPHRDLVVGHGLQALPHPDRGSKAARAECGWVARYVSSPHASAAATAARWVRTWSA